MYAFRTLLAVFAFSLLSVSAAPAHHRRRTCKAPSVSASVATSTSVSSAVSTSTAVASTSTHLTSSKASSTHASGSTVKSSSSSHHSTSSSAQPSATANAGPTSLLKKLFPVSHSASWTTSTASDAALPLDDGTLGVEKLLSELSHNYVTAPDGKKSMQAHYPEGSYTYDHDPQGGLSFYATGPSQFDLDNAKEVTFSYSVYFDEGFDWNKGGKLPGVFGGNSFDIAASCSGGRRDDRCFSARFMWRTDGKGEIYTYLPPDFSANKAVCNVAPESDCNDTYGASVGRGSFYFKAGARTTIGQRVRLNDVGQENGEIELFVEGKSIWTVSGLVLRSSSAGKFQGIQMQTFFGGHDSSWASPKSQNTYFSDFSMAITDTF
ncbi:hypothetical protein BD309DRAFT_357757 [Dichomitus squalens]|uniref:Polysaccharide lyase 14 domain-containing protein n=1 Tax=Dichomitus squalens TaxID=114155 RepID=A0A4V2K3F2_9APHY|nr:hypothetical protein BD311DRAFT_278358 [Dichomitus squalens]TBU40253.1 hypothetical protein BD309DRAFT_357757 [Dichomitus squalens]TBU57024.1 hypothetical protein BD310DRAFT_949677 [Dichomitus squalens]